MRQPQIPVDLAHVEHGLHQPIGIEQGQSLGPAAADYEPSQEFLDRVAEIVTGEHPYHRGNRWAAGCRLCHGDSSHHR